MYTAYVVATDSLRDALSGAIRSYPGTVLNGASRNLRQGLEECAQDPPGVLVLDDQVLEENIGLIEHLAQLTYPVVLVAGRADAETTRRALLIRARDVVFADNWRSELEGILARVARPLEGESGPGKVVAVFSSKGGVGKTTIAVNLGIAIAQFTHRPTALVDLDLQFGDVAPLVGDAPRGTIHSLVTEGPIDRAHLERVMSPVPGTPAAILPAPLEPQEAEDVHADQVVRILQLLRQSYPYVVVDTAPGYTEVNVAALDFADLILLVCMPDVVTLRTVSQALRLFLEGFRYPKEKVRVVLNRAGSHTGVEAPEIAAALGTAVDYLLPSDGAWPVKASNQGRPLVLMEPHSLFSEAIAGLARDLTGQGELPAPAVPVPEPRRSWWARGRKPGKAPGPSGAGNR